MLALLNLPQNAGALRHLARGRSPGEATCGPPAAGIDRLHLGTHPDVLARIWDDLNAALPADARWLVFDTPALVHPTGGTILAVALGTSYVLRLLPADLAAAVEAGAEQTHTYRSVGVTLDLPSTFGPDWAFGRWDRGEAAAVLASYHAAE